MRRLLPLLVVLGLVVACGDDEPAAAPLQPADGVSAPTTPTGDLGTVPAVPGAEPAPEGPEPVGDQPTGGAVTSPAPPPAAPAPGAPSPRPTSDPGTAPGPVAVQGSDAHLGPPGSFAGVLLRPEPAASLQLEVLVQPGARPSSAAVDRLAGELSRVSGKPVTTTTGTVEGDRTSWSAAEVRAAADANAGMPQGGRSAVIRLLYLRGSSSDADGALGIAVRGDVAAVFADEVRRAATPLFGSDAIERAVSLHEVGHLLGLVDLFLETGRADPEHPGHSSSDRSVMYWAVETGLFSDLTGGLPQDFDAADLADLATIRRG